MNLGFGNFTYDIDHDDGGSPLNPIDDDINITISFDVSNQGIYAIYDPTVDIAIYTVTTGNASALPWYELIGESPNNDLGTFHSFTTTKNNSITVDILPGNIVGFVTTNATLDVQISFSTIYAGIFINLNVSFETFWPGIL